jgi:nucleotide-binding universal stress UspA family protein
MSVRSHRVVLVGIESWPAGSALLQGAARLADAIDARLLIARVARQPLALDADLTLLQLRTDEDVAAQMFAETVESLQQSSVDWELAVVSGRPATRLAALANDHEVAAIVIGAQKPGWCHRVRRVFSGSVAARLASIQRAPVIVLGSGPTRRLADVPTF